MPSNADQEIKLQLIKKQPCFFELTKEEIELLAGMLVEVKFHAGESIVIEGSIVDSVYFIVSGTADVRHVIIKNQRIKIKSIATLGSQEAIGLNEKGFYSTTGERTATVIAKTDMVTFRLSVAAFHKFSESNPHVSEVMLKYAESFLGF